MILRLLLALLVVLGQTAGTAALEPSAAPPPLLRNYFELTITIDRQKLRLEAMEVRPRGPGPFPLVVLAHGKQSGEEGRRGQAPSNMGAEAVAFARRGFVAIVAMRPGYGSSQGRYAEDDGNCAATRYLEATRAGGRELVAIVSASVTRPGIDRSRILVAGTSVGGVATLALAQMPPPGVLGAINFSGGRGHDPDTKTVCQQDKLVETIRGFAKGTRLPSLWMYAENDRVFPPDLARAMHRAYAEAGGPARLVIVPPIPGDGHLLSRLGTAWNQPVDEFLKQVGLPTLPPQPPSDAPSTLAPKARDEFAAFSTSLAPFRAFATSPSGTYAWMGSTRSASDARRAALAKCQQVASACDVLAEISEIEDR